jgi:hypothetical protein
MEFGIYSFVELTPDADTGTLISPEQRFRDLLEEIELADQVGLELFGIGSITGRTIWLRRRRWCWRRRRPARSRSGSAAP